jgi:hypothetical protein
VSRAPECSAFANSECSPDSPRLGAAQAEEWRREMGELLVLAERSFTLLISALCDGNEKKVL